MSGVNVDTNGIFDAKTGQKQCEIGALTIGELPDLDIDSVPPVEIASLPQINVNSVPNITIASLPPVDFDRKLLDGFLNLKVAEPYTLFDSKLTTPSAELFWDDQETNLSDTVVAQADTSSTWNQNRASRTLTVNANVSKKRIRQARVRANYQPGKCNLWYITAVVGAVGTGITKRLGQLDKENGYFWEFTNSGISVGIRSKASGSVVDTKVAQANWNGDRLNPALYPNNSPSGIALDISKAQIFGCFYEWLGVGSVWFFVVINGDIHVVHRFDHANQIASVYMSTPVLPIHYEIANDGTGAQSTLECICCSIISYGGSQRTGLFRGITRSTGLTFNDNTSWHPLISVRINPAYSNTDVKSVKISVICTSSSNFACGTFINPGITGVDAASWQSLANSTLQYDVSRTASNTLVNTESTCMFAQLANTASDSINNISDAYWTIGTALNGTPDEIVLAVKSIAGNNETYYGSMSFIEAS